MDADFKSRFADILKSLQNEGITIIMVSHDVEFCAKYADRCGMFFDGGIVSEDVPSSFFGGKSFYTTAANRIARGIIENAVTVEDIIYACNGKDVERESKVNQIELCEKKEIPPRENKNKISISKVITGLFFAVIGVLLILLYSGKFTDWRMYCVDLGILLSFAAAFGCIIPQKSLGSEIVVQAPPNNRNLKKKSHFRVVDSFYSDACNSFCRIVRFR